MAKKIYSSNESKIKSGRIMAVLWILLGVVIVAAIVFSFFFVKNLEKGNEKEQLSKEQNLIANVLICISDNENKSVKEQFVLVGFNSKEKRISITEIPSKTKIKGVEKTATAQKMFEYGGGKYLREALQNCYGIKINKYLSCDMAEVEIFVDKLGGVDYNIKSKMKQQNSDGNLITNLVKGKQSLNGNQYCQFLRYNSWKNGKSAEKERAKILKALINSYNKTITSEDILAIYEKISNKFDTDISIIEMNNFSLKFRAFSKVENPAKVTDVDFGDKDITAVKLGEYYNVK